VREQASAKKRAGAGFCARWRQAPAGNMLAVAIC